MCPDGKGMALRMGWAGLRTDRGWIVTGHVAVHHPLGHLPDCGILLRSAGWWKNISAEVAARK